MIQTADDIQARILEQCVHRVAASVRMPVILDRDDLRQEGLLAIWQSVGKIDPARPASDASGFLRKRACGAMLDAVRSARLVGRRQPDPTMVPDDDAPEALTGETQTAEAAVVRACGAVLGLPHPLPLVFAALLAGATRQHLAAHLGVDDSRVSQHCTALHAALAKHLGPA